MLALFPHSHSKLSSEEGTPTKERKDPAPSITPESPQNKVRILLTVISSPTFLMHFKLKI